MGLFLDSGVCETGGGFARIQDAPVNTFSRSLVKWILLWTVLFLINLPLGVWLIVQEMDDEAFLYGMVAGLWVVWVIGVGICVFRTRWRLALVSGTAWLTWTQCCGVPHLLAGFLAFLLCGGLGLSDVVPEDVDEPVFGFFFAFTAAQLLLVCALILGLIVTSVFPTPSDTLKTPLETHDDEPHPPEPSHGENEHE